MFVLPVFVSFSACFLFPHASVVRLSILQYVDLCFWRPCPCAHPRPPPRPPRTQFPPQEYRASQVDASPISLVRVVRSAYSRIASIDCWAVGAGIHCSRIRMVVSYELDRVVKICVFMASSVIFLVVPINFLWKAISLVKYWVTV